MTKVGRNQPCPCGSGEKFKRCCGRSQPEGVGISTRREQELHRLFAKADAREFRRKQQQGLGRPIVSFDNAGVRFVAVGSTLHWSKNWRTFHDFLFHYVKTVFGSEWGLAEQAKPLEERNPVMQWNHELGRQRAEHMKAQVGKQVISGPITGAIRCYLGLAYNLYLLAHNVELQDILIKRLKNAGNFYGAYYETFVAAAFIKAGFALELLDQPVTAESHCEFAATSPKTGRRFSVEAKSRVRPGVTVATDPSTVRLGAYRKLRDALRQNAQHDRVVFVDVNLPPDRTNNGRPAWVDAAIGELREFEGRRNETAYVFVTNEPAHYVPSEVAPGLTLAAEGFRIPDFKHDNAFSSLRAALEARERHRDMHDLLDSLRTHYDIPQTFDGDYAELTFARDPSLPRLEIGEAYGVPDADGRIQRGVLETAVVMEREQRATGVYRLDDGRRVMASCPLSDEEMAAYRSHPETFFGEISNNRGEVHDAVGLFDFMHGVYRRTPKDRLLEFMKDWPDAERLCGLTQEELAFAYCERLATQFQFDRRNDDTSRIS